MCIRDSATALQERCGSFCSTGDVLGFRAVEHLRKAKEIGLRDQETLNYHLTNAAKLFERIVDDVSLDKIKEAVGIMLELNYYPKTVEFLLNIANAMDKGKLALQYVADGSLEHDERKKYYNARVSIYEIVFETLIKVDQLAALPENVNNQDIQKTRDEVYNVTLKYNDKLFHYQMYDWLVQQKSEEKLLQLDSDFILPYLEEKAAKSLEISNLLWVYQSKSCLLYTSVLFKAGDLIDNLLNFELIIRTQGFWYHLLYSITYSTNLLTFCHKSVKINEHDKVPIVANTNIYRHVSHENIHWMFLMGEIKKLNALQLE